MSYSAKVRARFPRGVTVVTTKKQEIARGRAACVHAVLAAGGRSTLRAPFGRGWISTVCGAFVASSANAYTSFTNDKAVITCPECKEVLDGGGWGPKPGAVLCDDCGRYRSEGHAADCVFVDWYGLSTEPRPEEEEGSDGER